MTDRQLFVMLRVALYLSILFYVILVSGVLNSPPLPDGGPYPQPMPAPPVITPR